MYNTYTYNTHTCNTYLLYTDLQYMYVQYIYVQYTYNTHTYNIDTIHIDTIHIRTIHRGCYMAVRRYGFYLRVLIRCRTNERNERVRDVFNSRKLNPYLQAAM